MRSKYIIEQLIAAFVIISVLSGYDNNRLGYDNKMAYNKQLTTCCGVHVINNSSNITLTLSIYPDYGNSYFMAPISPLGDGFFKIDEPNICVALKFDFSSNPSGGSIKIKIGTHTITCFNLSSTTTKWFDWCNFACGEDVIYTIEYNPSTC